LRWTLSGMGAGVIAVVAVHAIAGRRRSTKALR
jgi:hypothetical protein